MGKFSRQRIVDHNGIQIRFPGNTVENNRTGTITEVRVFSGAEVVFKANPGTKSINMEVPLKGIKLDKFIRVEAEGENRRKVMVSTPFFLD